MSIPQGWEPRHVEALRVWESGDIHRLCELCDHEIGSAARRVAYKLGFRDAIEQLQEEFGCKGVEKAAKRYDPGKGVPFQAYARQDIYWETRRGAEALLKSVPEIDEGPGYVEEEDTGQRWPSLEVALASLTLEEWRDVIKGLDKDNLARLRSYMDTHRTRLVEELSRLAEERGEPRGRGERRYWYIRLRVFEKIADNVLSRPGTKLVEVSGPQKMEIIERRRKAMRKLPAKVDDRAMGRIFDKDGKTIARWRRDTKKLGVPSTMKEDGSFALKGPEDWQEWFEYSVRVGAPDTWWRLQRRQQYSE